MTKDELIAALLALGGATRDPEVAHLKADELLLAFINNARVEEAYNAVEKWYA